VHYIRENPVRAGLAAEWRAWEFGGAMVPGYPDLDTRAEDFWAKFWRIYVRETEGPVSHETGHGAEAVPAWPDS
jgi:hypothetical protein